MPAGLVCPRLRNLAAKTFPQFSPLRPLKCGQAQILRLGSVPVLSQSAIELMLEHADPVLKHTYLHKMVSGEWTTTMNLTEPQAGSDLSLLRTKAVKEGDHYRISGQKIYISGGDHDLSDNIVHLVLARLPDAPPGNRGISLFLVPKYLVRRNGELGDKNDLRPISLETKLGIHGNPHLCDVVWRQYRCYWIPHWQREPARTCWHVHHDEFGPPDGRFAGCCHHRTRLSTGAGLRQGSYTGQPVK